MIRGESKCRMCPQNGRAKVASQIGMTAGVALIGDCPDVAEESRGGVFLGPRARILNLVIHQLGIMRSSLWMTNVVACRPPDNDIKCHEGRESIDCCRSGFKAELEQMKQSGIKVLVPMGQVALNALGIDGFIKKVRGSVYRHNGFLVVPTYDLDYLLHGGGKRGNDGINNIAAFTSDLKKALTIAVEGWTAPRELFNLTPNVLDVMEFVDRAIKNKSMIALDIETTGLDARRGAKVVVIGLADSTNRAIVVPFLKEGGQEYWLPGEKAAVRGHLERLFKQGRLLLQNCFFDIPFLMQHGWNISIDNVEHDTLVLHSLISPETEHNLGFIVSMYGETPEWKEDFKNRKMSILDMDQLEMRRYNARDCVVLHQVIVPMLEQLEEYGLTKFYNEETKPLMKPFMQMNLEGVGFDFAHMNAFAKKMDELINEKEKEIRQTFNLPNAFNFDSEEDLRWLVFRQKPNKFRKLQSCLVTYEKTMANGKVKELTKLVEGYDTVRIPQDLEPKDGKVLGYSVVDTLDWKRAGTKAYDDLVKLDAVAKIPEIYRLLTYKGLKTDTGKLKVSKDGLLSYRVALQNRLAKIGEFVHPDVEEEEAIVSILELIELLSAYKGYAKLKSDFTGYRPYDDGRVRAQWQMHGTSTGRLSVKNPPLATLPSRGEGSDVRRFFVPRDGWSIVDADYENAEVALLGYEAQDTVIIDIYESGKNIHDENTKILFGLDETSPLWKEGRKAAKVFQFGGLSYGGGDREIYKKVLMAAPALPLTFADFVKAKKAWMDAHPAYATWRNDVVERVLAKRRLYNAFGRMRIFLGHPKNIVKEGMNFMIQSVGACLINRAMIRIYDRVRAEGLQAKLIMQIYDEIVLECPDDEVDMVKAILVEEMQRPFQMHGRTCMIRAEAGVGKTYGDAK